MADNKITEVPHGVYALLNKLHTLPLPLDSRDQQLRNSLYALILDTYGLTDDLIDHEPQQRPTATVSKPPTALK